MSLNIREYEQENNVEELSASDSNPWLGQSIHRQKLSHPWRESIPSRPNIDMAGTTSEAPTTACITHNI